MDPAEAAAQFEVLKQFVSHQRLVVDFAHVACYTILFYDYALTLHLEIPLIWRSNWNYTKIIFLLTRYMPIANVYFLVYNQLVPNATQEKCETYYSVVTWLIFLSVECGEIILAVRTWAVWHQNRWIGILLVTILCGTIVVSCTTLSMYLKSLTFGPSPYPGFRGCFITHISTIVGANFISLTVLDSTVLFLMCLSALRFHRAGLNNELMNVIHRDGIMFYVYLLILAIGNVVVMYGLPLSMANLLSPWQSCMCSVFTSRIILNIRGAAKNSAPGVHTDLHIKEPMTRLSYAHNIGDTTFSNRRSTGSRRRDSVDDDDFTMSAVSPVRQPGAQV